MWGRRSGPVSRWPGGGTGTPTSLADGFNTSEAMGVNGVRTPAWAGTHTP